MRVLALEIYGFRGIREARLIFPSQVALVGPNGSGKSTLVDALSLVLGRQRLVRDLTEHDFTGSYPKARDRIRIVATIGGFSSSKAADYPQWFRHGRAVEKWWNSTTATVVASRTSQACELCVQIGFAARFDRETLEVEQLRYFHDDQDQVDPFLEDGVNQCPYKLVQESGFFVLPARRTWPATLSFGSELFRKVVTTVGGVPAERILELRDDLRSPSSPLEQDAQISKLVNRINAKVGELVPGTPKFQLRVTSTDSESVLRALVPHYEMTDGPSLPAARHGSGLVSLQSLVLLLELGRARKKVGESFILALEEPELHVSPGLQRRLIGEAARISDQVIVTTHAPRVAAFFDARRIQLLTQSRSAEGKPETGKLEARPLAPSSMVREPNPLVQLYTDDRNSLVEALMFPRLLVPEGRTDCEWLRLFLDVEETGEHTLHRQSSVAPFGSVVGVIPTREAAVEVTYQRLRTLHPDVMVLLDGDSAGDGFVEGLFQCSPPPLSIVQWPDGWTMEDVVVWVLEVKAGVVTELESRLDQDFDDLDAFRQALKNDDGRTGGLKTHYMAHEEIAGEMRTAKQCVQRVGLILDALSRAALWQEVGCTELQVDERRSTGETKVFRFIL